MSPAQTLTRQQGQTRRGASIPLPRFVIQHLQLRDAVLIQDGRDLAMPPLQKIVQSIAQCGVSLAHAHGNLKGKGKRGRVDLRDHRGYLKQSAIWFRKISGRRPPDDRQIHLPGGHRLDDGSGLRSSGFETYYVGLHSATRKRLRRWSVIVIED